MNIDTRLSYLEEIFSFYILQRGKIHNCVEKTRTNYSDYK